MVPCFPAVRYTLSRLGAVGKGPPALVEPPRMRILRALVAYAIVVAIPLIARADLWVNVNQKAGDSYNKVLYIDPRGNCAQPKGNGAAAQCTNNGSVTISWAAGPQAARDATCELSVWASGARPFPLTWHMDFSKNERGMCTAKWENDNTLDVDVATLPDYFITFAGPANADRYGLAVETTGGCRNSNTFDRNVRCSRAGGVTATWQISPGTMQKVCTINVAWYPWPANGLVPLSLNTPLCSLKKTDKTHADVNVKLPPGANPKP